MFEIEYKGGNCVAITTKKAKLVTDPKLSLVGLKDIDVRDKISLATEERFSIESDAAVLCVEGPGEYEVADFSIRGVAARRHLDAGSDSKAATIYRIEVGGVRIALLGNVEASLDDDQLESIGVVDIIILPVGGAGYTLDGTSAAQLMRKIDAKVAIPIHYADKGVSYEVPQDILDVFVKEFGGAVETVSKYKVKSPSSIPLVPTTIEITHT
jgi:L-ascorbate metabolism protein UlaG (beta-lactamase superfamily)